MADQATILPEAGMIDEVKPPRRDPIRSSLAIAMKAVAALAVLIIIAWLILFVTKGRFLKPAFEKYASRAAGRGVRVAGDFQLYLRPINIRFLAEGLSVSNPAWASNPTFFRARLIDASIATVPLIFGHRRANWLTLADGDVDLEWDAAAKRNTWTFGDPNRPAEPLTLPAVRRAYVTGTKLHYRDPAMQLVADIGFNTIRARDTRFASAIRFSGGGAIRTEPFAVAGSLLSPNETVAGGRNQLVARALGTGNIVDIAGTLPGATELEGSDLRLTARGRNLARLFDFLGVAIPDTRAYRVTSRLTKTGDAWRFTHLAGGFGDSDLAGRMTISTPNNRLFIDADVASRVIDIIDVGPFIGYDARRLAAMGGKGAIQQVAGAPRLLPDAELRADALKNFDAHVDYSARRIRAEHLPVSNIALTLDLDHKLLKLSPLTFDIAGGHLASDIVIDARGPAVLTDYDVRLAPTPMGRLLAGFGVDESGTSGVMTGRVQLKGAGDTVHESLASANGRIAVILPRGSFWTRNIQLSELDIGTFITKLFQDKLKKPVQINCGLIAFTVRDGVATADPILIDTAKNVMLGRGQFSFKDESLNLSVRADGKKFSLVSAQSPIGVAGHFASPRINPISPELLTRGGVGLALGIVASPLAAILAFVDVGDAKSAACGPILSGAQASAQRTTKGNARDDVGGGRG